MKDVYELFNDVNIDVDDYEEIEVTDLEKKIVKSNLRKSIKKRKVSWKKKTLEVASVVVISAAALGLAFPTHARNIPIVGNIFQTIDENLFSNFQEFSDEIGITQVSDGISITVNEAVFDGQTVFFTYSIQSDRDLGDYINLDAFPSIRGSNASGSGSRVNRVAENQYVGITWITGIGFNRNSANVNWDVNGIYNNDVNIDERVTNGNWNFAFSLGRTNNDEKLVNKSVAGDGVEVTVNKLSITPMSFSIHFEEIISELQMMADLIVKDDLGNEYEMITGSGTETETAEGFHSDWTRTFGEIHPDATKLTITPRVFLGHTAYVEGEVSEVREGNTVTATVEVEAVEIGEDINAEALEENWIFLDDIVIELQ